MLAHYKEAIVSVLRPRAILGVGDTVVFPRLLRAHKEGKLRVIGKGDNVIDFHFDKKPLLRYRIMYREKRNSTSTNLQCNEWRYN